MIFLSRFVALFRALNRVIFKSTQNGFLSLAGFYIQMLKAL